MEQDTQKPFSLEFDDELERGYPVFDPLADMQGDEDDEDDGMSPQGQLAPSAQAGAIPRYAQPDEGRTAAQRIEDLFVAMAARRRVLLEVLRFLDEPRHAGLLTEKVDELQEIDLSVYTGYNFAVLLEEAGAVRKVNGDGSLFDEEAEQMPDIVEVDGLRFFKPTDGKQVFWVATEEGRAYLEADDPFGRLTEMLAEEPQYQPVYKGLLEYCDNGEGRTANDLAGLIDSDPLVQQPRRYSSYFSKRLEDCGALVWARKWQTTEVGRKGLELLLSCGLPPKPLGSGLTTGDGREPLNSGSDGQDKKLEPKGDEASDRGES
ncbi:MAG: hypothetical protein LBG81_00475 [Coriobacteriaceae bacterium]|jgi:hypothetical protein|nr:hypothetical protein [Coriobacteriaceae bacterium]